LLTVVAKEKKKRTFYRRESGWYEKIGVAESFAGGGKERKALHGFTRGGDMGGAR